MDEDFWLMCLDILNPLPWTLERAEMIPSSPFSAPLCLTIMRRPLLCKTACASHRMPPLPLLATGPQIRVRSQHLARPIQGLLRKKGTIPPQSWGTQQELGELAWGKILRWLIKMGWSTQLVEGEFRIWEQVLGLGTHCWERS